jgi:lipoprotein-releasing system permease protein
MRFEAFVASRYLRGKRKNRFVNLITVISIAGVSVGVIALIVVMSVMTGFDIELRDTIIGNRAHLLIQRADGDMVKDVPAAMAEIEEAAQGDILASGPITQIEALLRPPESYRGNHASGALILGVDPELESDVTMLKENLGTARGRQFGRGELPGKKEIVLGYLLADRLGVLVGDDISVLTFKDRFTPYGTRKADEIALRVSGIFQAQMSEYDTLYAFVDIQTAQMITGRTGVDGIHSKLTDPILAGEVAERINGQFKYRAATWYEQQEAFFKALEQEKLAMFIILVFIVLVAAFNITSTLIMVVMEKRRDIGILRTLGVSGPSILLLFMMEGIYIGVSGTFFGVLFGTLLAYNVTPVAEFIAGIFNVDLFNSTIYYFDHIPVAVVWADIMRITVAAIVLTFLSTLYPAWSATRVDPVDALRNE